MVRTAGPNIVTTNKKIMHDIHGKYGELCFKNYIMWETGYVEAAAQAAPVFSLREKNAMRVAEQYKEVTKEFLQKVDGDLKWPEVRRNSI